MEVVVGKVSEIEQDWYENAPVLRENTGQTPFWFLGRSKNDEFYLPVASPLGFYHVLGTYPNIRRHESV